MTIEILHRRTHAVLYSSTASSLREAIEQAAQSDATLRYATLRYADLRYANLRYADLLGANLLGANLLGADLLGADLRGANLHDANLRDANLLGANLLGANLLGATGLSVARTTPLYMLLDQPGYIRTYKLVTDDGVGPIKGGITYSVGESYSVDNANTDPAADCGAGINLATLDWCLREWRPGCRVLIAEHTAADIAAIPIGSDGKYRVHRCTIVAEKDVSEWVQSEEVS